MSAAPMNLAERRVAHLDMDAFFASVELLRYPELRGLPVVVGGAGRASQRDGFARLRDYVGRGVVTTATYAAREFGVHSAMGLMKAAQKCPEAILLPADFEQYRRYSRLFKQTIAELAPCIEDRGIDEVYIDFTMAEGGTEQGGRVLAARIQAAIHERTGLTCSVGIAPNKLLAKIASELHKPNGITVLFAADLEPTIWPLPCRRISGIGPKAGARLEELGIRTIGELARCEVELLSHYFGPRHGAWMHAAAHGRDERTVQTHSAPVSLSRETTFERDLHARHDRERLRAIFLELCERVAADLRRHGYAARTVGVKLRYADFSRVTRDQTLGEYTHDAAIIRRAAGQCLQRAPLGQRLRLLGVKVSGLRPIGAVGGPDDSPPAALELPL